jgi:hypothetical protein
MRKGIPMKALFRDGLKILRAGAIAGALLTASAAAASAAPISYTLTFSGLMAGNAGTIDLFYVPGEPSPPPATATITSFDVDNGSLGAATSTGNVTGTLPGTVTFGNSATSNVSQALTFGNTLSFDLTLDGDALSTFIVQFSVDPIDSNPAPAFGALMMAFDSTGLTGYFVSPGPSGEPAPAFTIAPATLTAVPEPATLVLLSTGVLGLIVRRRK